MATEALPRTVALQRGIQLEYLTVGWNLVEGLVSVIAGAIAGSVALVGFGVDSWIETSSGAILLWRLHSERTGGHAEALERKALRLVGFSFVLLAGYVAWDAVVSLLKREAPERSIAGVTIAVLSLIVMPLLARAKRRAARALSSAALQADSRQTSLCAYLSAILLSGLLLNSLAGWWWADPVAALVMVPIIGKEGFDALRGKACADCH
ncbi:MAG TPA: cation transporter [Terriglobales bacterium]|nr:cation transporter [Terriglobales bacterium]